MQFRILLFTFLLIGFVATTVHADSMELKQDTSWTTGGSVGLDLSQLTLINPKIGAGENKFSLGGLTSLFAKYKKGSVIWDTDGSLQLAMQRLGSSDNAFTKNLDLLRVNSQFGYVITPKLNGAMLVTFESLLLPTYSDLSLSSNADNYLQAKFLAPASLIVAPGLEYKADEHHSVFFAPVAYKTVIVTDDEIASLGVHGNPWTSVTEYENIKHEMGTHLKAKYNNVYFKKMSVGSELSLFYDYLADDHGLEYVDVIWVNEIGYEIFKGLSLNVLLDFRWDRDIASVLDEGIVPDGLEEFRKWMITEAFVLKYNYLIK